MIVMEIQLHLPKKSLILFLPLIIQRYGVSCWIWFSFQKLIVLFSFNIRFLQYLSNPDSHSLCHENMCSLGSSHVCYVVESKSDWLRLCSLCCCSRYSWITCSSSIFSSNCTCFPDHLLPFKMGPWAHLGFLIAISLVSLRSGAVEGLFLQSGTRNYSYIKSGKENEDIGISTWKKIGVAFRLNIKLDLACFRESRSRAVVLTVWSRDS